MHRPGGECVDLALCYDQTMAQCDMATPKIPDNAQPPKYSCKRDNTWVTGDSEGGACD